MDKQNGPHTNPVEQFLDYCKNHRVLSVVCILGIVVISIGSFTDAASGLAVLYQRVFGERALRQETIIIFQSTWHVGDDNREDYPEATHGGKPDLDFIFTIPKTPQSAVLLVEVYDVDNIAANFFLNGSAFARLAPGHGWHEQHFTVPEGLARKGDNKLRVKSKEWSGNQVEDFLMRNGRLVVRY